MLPATPVASPTQPPFDSAVEKAALKLVSALPVHASSTGAFLAAALAQHASFADSFLAEAFSLAAVHFWAAVGFAFAVTGAAAPITSTTRERASPRRKVVMPIR